MERKSQDLKAWNVVNKVYNDGHFNHYSFGPRAGLKIAIKLGNITLFFKTFQNFVSQ